MSEALFNKFIGPLIEREGGDRVVVDTGGTTKFGISQKGTGLTSMQIKDMRYNEAVNLYKHLYYYKSKCHKLPEYLQEMFFDTVVNQGKSRATKILQKAVNHKHKEQVLKVDGMIGPKTLSKVEGLELERFKAFRLLHYTSIVLKKPDRYEKFFFGWYNRVKEF